MKDRYGYGYIANKLSEFKLSSRLEPETGCWVWHGPKDKDGYGVFSFKGRRWLAHQVALMFDGREVPKYHETDHLCRNRACVNPAHLELVTHRVNMLRGLSGHANRSKTHCPKGHPYEGENLVIFKRKDGGHGRNCRACMMEACKKYYEQRKKRAGLSAQHA
jgi:hypothetical protein